MDLTVSYRHTSLETRVLTEVTAGAQLKDARFREVFNQVWLAISLALAIGVAFQAESFFLMCFFFTTLGFHLVNANNARRNFWQSILHEGAGVPDREVTLSINDDGLHETAEGICSHATWSAVKSFTLHKNTLIIRLPANLHAVIPASSLKPEGIALESIVRALRERGVSETKTRRVW